MEENNNISSCLLWGVGLYTPVDLGSVFKPEDYCEKGLELDSHITILYSQNKILPRNTMMDDIKTILGEEKFEEFMSYCKNERFRNIFNLFELSSFSNDTDYVVLKLRKNNEFFGILNLLNKGLRVKYKVSSDFDEFTPHVTLAQVRKGEARKYVDNPNLHHILDDSRIDFEDLIYSVDSTGDKDWKQIFLTHNKNVDRFFRLEDLKKSNEELSKGDDLI